MPRKDSWSEEEIGVAVAAYVGLLELEQRGDDFSPTAVHRRLAAGPLSGRSEGSVARRMSNISSVLSENAHDYVSRYKPTLNHVGTRVAGMILDALAKQGVPAVDALQGFALLQRANAILDRGLLQTPTGSPRPETHVRTITIFARSPEVVAWVLGEAKGRCEACKQSAPFHLATGKPYLEVHHVLRLADGGPDVVENAVALCPNCHRRLHHSADAETYRRELIASIDRLKDFAEVDSA